ncbi:uncharacterized protein [Battus philenor]|uniref:uncharacterized protein n=1 Tax=Battus philenor TaxID=42288 RepID=UPI0035D13471
MKCAGCAKLIKELGSIKCTSSTCGKSFCTLCINVAAITNEKKHTWKCPECCASQKKGGDNSFTPIRSAPENITLRKKPDLNGSEMSQLTEQLRLLTSEFTSVKNKLDDLTQSIAFTNERLEEVMLKWNAAEERIKLLEKREREVESLQVTVLSLQQELSTQTQNNLKNEIEIVGMPETASENLYHTILVAAKKVGVELEEKDIDWISRVGPRRPPVTTALPEDGAKLPRPVVVRFLRRTKRDLFLKAIKSRRNLSSSDLDISGSPKRIFFNERLTKENRALFRDARLRAKQHGYNFCWCIHGAIYVRQREGKPAILIRSHKDLENLIHKSVSTDSC